MPGRGPDPIATPCARAPDAAITLASASVIFLAPHFNLVSASEVCRPKSYQGSSTPDPDGMLRLHSCNYRSRAMLAPHSTPLFSRCPIQKFYLLTFVYLVPTTFAS